MGKYKAAVINEANGKFTFEERDIPKPGPGKVLLKVKACGVCHSDVFTVSAGYPGITLPRVPGHEVIGVVEEVGEGVKFPQVGALVGVGWHHNHCGTCRLCREGNMFFCKKGAVSGIHVDGGYAEYMIADWSGCAEMPEGTDAVEAAPLLCAGVTVFHAIRRLLGDNLMPGDLVAVQGIGGLGHLAVQFAKAMGFRVAAISTSNRKEELARRLGAHIFVDLSKQTAQEAFSGYGGARLIIATAPAAESMAPLLSALGVNGKLLLAGADANTFPLSPFQLIPNRGEVCGVASGMATDSADTVSFAQLTGCKSMNEVYDFADAQQAYDDMMAGKPRFRAVLKMN
eukprot:Clim_evm80s22 gene=Clim_evmTU80s22